RIFRTSRGSCPASSTADGSILRAIWMACHGPLGSMSETAMFHQLRSTPPTATVDAAVAPVPAAARELNRWRGETVVNGPAWPEFAKAMGLDDAAKTAGSVYVVSVFRAAPGHRDELEKSLAQPGPGTAGNVMLQHLEGGPWHFLTVARYSSWE